MSFTVIDKAIANTMSFSKIQFFLPNPSRSALSGYWIYDLLLNMPMLYWLS